MYKHQDPRDDLPSNWSQDTGEKCHGFYIKPTKDSSYTISDCPVWMINGTPLNMIDPAHSEKYLGLQIDPWTGIADTGLCEKPEISFVGLLTHY